MLTETVGVERVASPVGGEIVLSRDDLANKIKVSAKKIDDYQNTTGQLLIEAKRRCREFGMTFSAFVCGKCGMKTSRAYELIAKAEGRTNEDEVRAERRERNARYTAKNKAARDSVLDGKTASSDPLSEQRDIVMLAMKDASLADWLKLAKCAVQMKSARDVIKDKADRADRDSLAKTTPTSEPAKAAALEARRKRKADDKTVDDYFKQFGAVSGISITPDVLQRMEASLTSGVDDDKLVAMKLESERQQAEYVRAETHRRATLNEPLLAPITPEKEKAYTRIIKTRTLWHGACGLSWPEYFEWPPVTFPRCPLR